MTNSEITEGDITISSFHNYAKNEITFGVNMNPMYKTEKKAEQLKQKIITALRLLDWVEQEAQRLIPLSYNSIERSDCLAYLKSLLNQAKGEKK